MVMSNHTTEVYPHRLRRLYWPFLAIAESCQNVVGMVAGSFTQDGNRYTIPRFTLLGPETSVPQKRIGIFSLLHGDEAACATALLHLLQELADDPAPAAGYDLVIYPVCNPTGYEDGTRHNRNGMDLNREFWRGSSQPEIVILERELRAQSFDGIIALHADDTCDGLYGYTQGRVLNENLLQPALRASAQVLPLDCRPVIDSFSAREAMICECYPGILAPPPEQRPQPFEIIFETPANALPEKQAEAARIAIRSILASYRGFIAYAQDL